MMLFDMLPLAFVLFGAMLLGIAVWHHRSFEIAVAGVVVITIYTVLTTDIELTSHLRHEAPLVLNLLGLLLGFAILAKHFEASRVPDWLPRWLPDTWMGGFVLLVLVAVLSTFLDNIAAAVIGGVMARTLYRGNVGVGFLAAIVAASNAGGAGSVLGDTTTTMMWVAGVPAWKVAQAFLAAAVAIVFSGIIAAKRQQRVQPIVKDPDPGVTVDGGRLLIVALMITGAIAANVLIELPAAGVWLAILLGGFIRPTPWQELARSLKGSVFLIALVLSAGLMPVSSLPAPSWQTAFGLGWLSAVFDNIPLTALALRQGGYDWDFLAFAVGYGGSMIWFGSSAGVAISNAFPEVKDIRRWLVEGWHIPVAYVLGFFALLLLVGWHPNGR
jgi:Na+/H+ antiporter NhaD/arsenite permease-like protein